MCMTLTGELTLSMLIASFTGNPTYNAETSQLNLAGANGTLTLNIEDPGTGLVDEVTNLLING